jgi:exopolysaccharide biosynthesis polyprenyl glycosylphosphotransferase
VEAVSAAPEQLVAPLAPVERLLARAAVARPHIRTARLARAAVMVVDMTAVAIAMAVSFGVTKAAGWDGVVAAEGYQRVGALALPVWLLVFHRYHLYNARHVAGRRDELSRMLHAVGLGTVLTALIAYGLGTIVARGWLLLLFGVATVAVAAEREVVRGAFNAARRRGHLLRPVALIGTGEEAVSLATAFAEHPELGYRVVAIVGDAAGADPRLEAMGPILDPKIKLAEQVRMAGAGGVLIATTDIDAGLSNRLVRTLTEAGVHVELSSSLRDIDATRLSIRPLGRHPVLYVEPVRRNGWRAVAKRTFDVVLSALGLAVISPLWLLIALGVKCTSAGPVLFRQERVGRRGRRFFVYKFRTMVVDAEQRLVDLRHDNEADGPLFKLRQDPRITPFGRVLRKLSLDELPQLINVLKGEMSLVGPRPALPGEVTQWGPELFERLRVQPGITGMWQVNGRSNSSFSEYQRWDLYYVDNWSIWRDLAILFKTLPVVLSQKGAY